MRNLLYKRFKRLTVIKQHGRDNNRHVLWLCKCDCGQEVVVKSSHLITGHTQSCGCLKKEGNNTKHTHTRKGKPSRVYKTWASMIQRCTNPNTANYHRYGGRGISIYKKWENFENFLKDMPGWEPGLQIDRINNNKGYYKSNCRWATPKQQARNRDNNYLVTFNNKTQCLAAWSEEFNISYKTLWKRIHTHKWSAGKALTTPAKPHKKGRIK